MKVTKAVIPAAGLGTRVLPASKSVPKEMLNIVDKPAIQYLVEEAAASGITDILIITNRGKSVIEDHFDRSFELEDNLRGKKGKEELYESILKPSELANIYYIRQKETKGLAHAIHTAKTFVGSDPFAVLYGDDIIINNEYPVTKQLIDAFGKYGKCTVGVHECPKEQVMKYCTLDVTPIENNVMNVSNIVEKPKEDEILSYYSILGRNLLTPEIFEYIERTPVSPVLGEVLYTDSMTMMAREKGLTAVDFIGRRYDMGDKLGIMQANCEVALSHPEIGERFKNYLKELVKTF